MAAMYFQGIYHLFSRKSAFHQKNHRMCELEGIIKYKYMQKVTPTVALITKSQTFIEVFGKWRKGEGKERRGRELET